MGGASRRQALGVGGASQRQALRRGQGGVRWEMGGVARERSPRHCSVSAAGKSGNVVAQGMVNVRYGENRGSVTVTESAPGSNTGQARTWSPQKKQSLSQS